MHPTQLLTVPVVVVLLLSQQHGVRGQIPNLWKELSAMYGTSAANAIGWHLSLALDSSNYDEVIQNLQNISRVQPLCQYVQQSVNRCVQMSQSDFANAISERITTTCCEEITVVDGNWGSWGGLSTCTQTCGGGTQSRTRACNNPPPSGGGQDCVGSNSETFSCNTQACVAVVNGNWGPWGGLSTCTQTCGGGTQSRTRACNNPPPSGGGQDCVGSNSETFSCNTQACAVNGNWGQWGGLSTCTQTCGGGTQSRTRACNNPPPSDGGLDCVGSNSETFSCNTQACAVNGNWGQWGGLSTCTQTCGGGTQSRTRACNNPPPSDGGLDCVGSNSETFSCNTQACAVNGNWGQWGGLSTCTQTCGGGTQSRTRACNNPPPSDGGQDCVGLSSESSSCNIQACPVNGNWGQWGGLSTCTQTCGGGTQSRTRACNNPPPSGGGLDCVGLSSESSSCNTQACPVDGSWGQWGDWSTCTQTCGGGIQSRTRACNNPPPSGGGLDCVGSNSESGSCNTQLCCGVVRAFTSGRILGGTPATLGQYPWAVHVLIEGSIQCAGAIIDEYTVLTAGHCMDGYVTDNVVNYGVIEVVAGQYSRSLVLEPGAQRISNVTGRRFPDYDDFLLLDDLTVLRLPTPLVFSDTVSPICLPTPDDQLPAQCVVAGWGTLSFFGPLPDVLQHVRLDVYNNVECEEEFTPTYPQISSYLTDGVMCASNGTSGGKDSCRGDSGAPLVCLQTSDTGTYYTLFGLVSSGFDCGLPGYPGLYTNIPHYIDWIYQTINEL